MTAYPVEATKRDSHCPVSHTNFHHTNIVNEAPPITAEDAPKMGTSPITPTMMSPSPYWGIDDASSNHHFTHSHHSIASSANQISPDIHPLRGFNRSSDVMSMPDPTTHFLADDGTLDHLQNGLDSLLCTGDASVSLFPSLDGLNGLHPTTVTGTTQNAHHHSFFPLARSGPGLPAIKEEEDSNTCGLRVHSAISAATSASCSPQNSFASLVKNEETTSRTREHATTSSTGIPDMQKVLGTDRRLHPVTIYTPIIGPDGHLNPSTTEAWIRGRPLIPTCIIATIQQLAAIRIKELRGAGIPIALSPSPVIPDPSAIFGAPQSFSGVSVPANYYSNCLPGNNSSNKPSPSGGYIAAIRGHANANHNNGLLSGSGHSWVPPGLPYDGSHSRQYWPDDPNVGRPTSLDEIKHRGLIRHIPKVTYSQQHRDQKRSSFLKKHITPLVCQLIEEGYDIRLGEKGRTMLKKEISLRFRIHLHLRESCHKHVCRLKNANVIQLLAMSEITGCLPRCLEIANDYWRSYGARRVDQSSSAHSPRNGADGIIRQQTIQTPRNRKRTRPKNQARPRARAVKRARVSDGLPESSDPEAQATMSDTTNLLNCDNPSASNHLSDSHGPSLPGLQSLLTNPIPSSVSSDIPDTSGMSNSFLQAMQSKTNQIGHAFESLGSSLSSLTRPSTDGSIIEQGSNDLVLSYCNEASSSNKAASDRPEGRGLPEAEQHAV